MSLDIVREKNKTQKKKADFMEELSLNMVKLKKTPKKNVNKRKKNLNKLGIALTNKKKSYL